MPSGLTPTGFCSALARPCDNPPRKLGGLVCLQHREAGEGGAKTEHHVARIPDPVRMLLSPPPPCPHANAQDRRQKPPPPAQRPAGISSDLDDDIGGKKALNVWSGPWEDSACFNFVKGADKDEADASKVAEEAQQPAKPAAFAVQPVEDRAPEPAKPTRCPCFKRWKKCIMTFVILCTIIGLLSTFQKPVTTVLSRHRCSCIQDPTEQEPVAYQSQGVF